MGVYYYLVNNTKKQYAGHFGKRGEFCMAEICFTLGWLGDDVEAVGDGKYDYFVYDYEKEEFTHEHVCMPDKPLVWKYAINHTKKEYHEHKHMEFLDDIDATISNLNWSPDDKIVFMNPSQCGWVDRNCDMIDHRYVDIHGYDGYTHIKMKDIPPPIFSDKMIRDIDIICV